MPFTSGDVAAEELGRHRAAGDRVGDLAAAAVEDDDLARVLGLLAADLGEEGGEAVVVVHRPAVERMVVALGALDAHAHEDLGGVLGELQRVGLDLVVVGGGVLERAAVGAEQLLDDLVHRHVVGELVLEPVVVEQRGLVAELWFAVRADLQQLGPLHHPHLDELLAAEQLVDQLLALLRVGGWP